MSDERPRSVPLRSAGVIPASGSSVRMGTPKALLRHDGRTFLNRAVEALRGGGCDPVLVVLATAGQEEARAEAERAGATVLLNPTPGEGPITSLRLALAELDDGVDGLVLLPLDHPLVGAPLVRALLDAVERTGAPLALPVTDSKRGHPTWFSRGLFAELADPGLRGGARTVVHDHIGEALLLETSDRAAITDVDTPSDYAALGSGPTPAPGVAS